MKLGNFEQQQAIDTLEGPLLIIAGPGSGKTFTLVERIVNLVSRGICPENILVATFTDKAAKELITRVSNRLLEERLEVNLNEMYIGTIHSILLRFLEEFRDYSRLKRNYRLLDDFEQKYFIYRNINSYLKVDCSELLLGDPKQNRWEKAKNLIYLLGKISESPGKVSALMQDKEPRIRILAEFYKIYSEQLVSENLLDFSAIQAETLFMLQNHSQVLDKLQDKIHYLMIDEYQDTNAIQESILLLLAAKRKNICVVGDDDQSLYRFRGATIRNILEFPNNFSEGQCKRVILSTNYRSHPDIINFYNSWMNECQWSYQEKTFRFDKTIKPADGEFTQNVSVIRVGSQGKTEDYYQEIYSFIKELNEKKIITDYSQIAFLFKSVRNDKVIDLYRYLEERGINVFSPRSGLFFERDEIKLLVGLFVFIFPTLLEDLKWSEDAHLSVWDYYQECKAFFVEELKKDKTQNKTLVQWCIEKAKFHQGLTKNTTYAFAALFYQVMEFPLFAKFLQVESNSQKHTLRPTYNLGLFSKLLFKFEYLYNISVLKPKELVKTLRDLFNNYLRFIIEGGIEEYEDFDEYAPSGCVSFLTIHQSKGLEFPIVLVGSMNLVPRQSFDELDVLLQEKLEPKSAFEPIEYIKNFDFWRLFYTAFSRPQNLLVLTTHEKAGRGKSPSKYFENLYYSLPSWRDKSFDINKLEISQIKPVNIKHEYSFTSHILLYENCPLQYKYYKEFEFVEVRTGSVLGGNLLHQTIEDIHRAVLRGEESNLTDERITQWFNDNYFLLSKHYRASLQKAQQDSILKQVLRYRDKNQQTWHLLQEAEVEVSLVKEDYILTGAIDLIRGENDTVELIDFKSGDKPDVNSRDSYTVSLLQRYRRQLEIYAYLVEKRYGYKVSKLHLYYPKVEDGNPRISFPVLENHIQATMETFDEVVKKIESKNYDMNHIVKSEKQCANCDMRYFCNPRHYTS